MAQTPEQSPPPGPTQSEIPGGLNPPESQSEVPFTPQPPPLAPGNFPGALDRVGPPAIGSQVRAVFIIWIIVFGLVGSQMGWIMRPFIGAPDAPVTLFRSRDFAGANLLTLWLYAALGGALFFLPFNLIQVQGYSATGAGAALLPFILLMFLLSRWSGGLVDRYGARKPLIVGPLVAGAGFALLAVPGLEAGYWKSFFPAVLVLGFGMAISVAPLTTTVMGAVDESHAGLASGINNAVSRAAGLLAVAGMGILLLGLFSPGLDRRLDGLGLPPEIRQGIEKQKSKLAAIEIPKSMGERERAQVRAAIDKSFLAGFRAVMLAAAGLALLASASTWWMIRLPLGDR